MTQVNSKGFAITSKKNRFNSYSKDESTTAENANTNDDATIVSTNFPDEEPKYVPKNKRNKDADGMPLSAANYPKHIVSIALLIKNNAEIRRFTALGILNYLTQKGEISGKSRYVSFKWNKFAVKCDGLMREYSYNEPWFINALVASFSSFSASAQRTIDTFTHKEMSVGIEKAVDQEEVEAIICLNEKHSNSSVEEIGE